MGENSNKQSANQETSYKVTSLAAAPHLIEKTLDLIESSFQYTSPFHYSIDFYPLFNSNNFQNCFIITDEDETHVLAHVGKKNRFIVLNNSTFQVALIGGVCVHESFRGQGFLRKLMVHLLNTDQKSALFLTWSEKLDLYEKFLFYPCFEQYEFQRNSQAIQANSNFEKVKFCDLDDRDKQQILYLHGKQESKLQLARSITDWEDIEQIYSSTLYYKKDSQDQIASYFFMNKGMDLKDIIHEYYFANQEDLIEMSKYGRVWGTATEKEILGDNSTCIYGALARIGKIEAFSALAEQLTDQVLTNIQIQNRGHEAIISFDFQGQTYDALVDVFLRGLFGPGRFIEINQSKPFFLNGLDSV